MDYLLLSVLRILDLVVLSQSYNLLLGYTGIVHVGHVAFKGIGAYTTALLALSGVPFWLSALCGMAAAGMAGLLLAIPTVRLRDDYLVAATLGMGEIIRLVILNERQFTGGSTGLPNIPRPEIFGISLNNNFYYLILITLITIVALYIMARIIRSPFGKSLESIRDDEIASQSLGENIASKKLQILVIGAIFAGLSGVMEAHTSQFIDPDLLNIQYMVFLILQVVFGGKGTMWGPILGATSLYIVFEMIRFIPLAPAVLGPLRWIIFAVMVIFVIIYKPTGLLGKKLLRKKL